MPIELPDRRGPRPPWPISGSGRHVGGDPVASKRDLAWFSLYALPERIVIADSDGTSSCSRLTLDIRGPRLAPLARSWGPPHYPRCSVKKDHEDDRTSPSPSRARPAGLDRLQQSSPRCLLSAHLQQQHHDVHGAYRSRREGAGREGP